MRPECSKGKWPHLMGLEKKANQALNSRKLRAYHSTQADFQGPHASHNYYEAQ